MADPARDVVAYATLAVELADPEIDRAATLAAAGLDEDGWEALDDAWQARLSTAIDEHDGEGVPPLIQAHADAFAAAQRARVKEELSFERFVETTRALRHGGDLGAALRRLGVPLDAFLRAQIHWTARMIEDEALAERFRAGLG